MKEEKILFPAIRALSQGEHVEGCFGHIGNPINAMQHEHEEAGAILQKLHELTNDFHSTRTCLHNMASMLCHTR